MGTLIVVEKLNKPDKPLKLGRVMRIHTHKLIGYSTDSLCVSESKDGWALCDKLKDNEPIFQIRKDGVIYASPRLYYRIGLYAEKAKALYFV